VFYVAYPLLSSRSTILKTALQSKHKTMKTYLLVVRFQRKVFKNSNYIRWDFIQEYHIVNAFIGIVPKFQLVSIGLNTYTHTHPYTHRVTYTHILNGQKVSVQLRMPSKKFEICPLKFNLFDCFSLYSRR
jgi:hypothetical protein